MDVPSVLTRLPSVVPVAAEVEAASVVVVVHPTTPEAGEEVTVEEGVDIVCAGPAYPQISANMFRWRWRRLRWWTSRWRWLLRRWRSWR